jgi:hypothetical protein
MNAETYCKTQIAITKSQIIFNVQLSNPKLLFVCNMEIDNFLVEEKLRGGSATSAQKLKLGMLNSVSASG